MRWTERQRRMLEAMGLRLWSLPAPVDADSVRISIADASPPAAPTRPAVPRSAATAARAAPVSAAVRTLRPESDSAAAQPVVPARSPGDEPEAQAAPTAADLDARAREIATLDWDALRAAVASCTACGLCRSRRQTVFGVGHPHARWMVVGEAPGEQEDLKGEPFVGPAGKLLDAMLRSIGLTREEAAPERQVYIANTLKCRPPRNRNPEPDELARCEPFLLRQIDLVRPRIILAMGRFAVQALLRSSEPIGKLRGRVHSYHGVPLVVTYHPAYLLRNLVDKARAWDDLCLAAATAEAAGEA